MKKIPEIHCTIRYIYGCNVMNYRRKFPIFERTAWLRELKLLKDFTYRLLVQIQPSQQLLKAITSQQQPSFCVMSWEAGIA